jgi:DNA polymerase (family 10)
MRYGVVTARRGWLEAADILNTRPLGEFKAALARATQL